MDHQAQVLAAHRAKVAAQDPWTRTIPPLPTALAIDRVANAMAASLGMMWAKMEIDARSRFRIMASAALIAQAVENYRALVLLRQEIEGSAAALRAATIFVDGQEGPESIARGLTLAAAVLEKICAVLEAAPGDAGEDDAEPI